MAFRSLLREMGAGAAMAEGKVSAGAGERPEKGAGVGARPDEAEITEQEGEGVETREESFCLKMK